MAGENSFKQKCPTCEALVVIKSASMIGKQTECPKCKDRFAVVKPAPRKTEEEDEYEEVAPIPPPKPRPAPSANKAAPKSKSQETYAVEDDEEPTPQPRRASAGITAKKPAAKPSVENDEDDDDVPLKPPVKKPAVKPKAAVEDDEDEEAVEAEEDDEPVKPVKKPAVKPKAQKHEDEAVEKPSKSAIAVKKVANKLKAKEAEEASEPEPAVAPKKKFSLNLDLANIKKSIKSINFRSTKALAGVAVVGVLFLVTAAYFIMSSGPSTSTPIKKPPIAQNPAGKKPPDKAGETNKGTDAGNDGKKEDNSVKLPPDIKPAGPELTNLLPADAEQVVRYHFANMLASKLNDAAFRAFNAQNRPFSTEVLEKRLGFSPTKIDAIIQAERFAAPAWCFTVVHLTDRLDEAKLVKALGMEKLVVKAGKDQSKDKKLGKPAAKQVYYRVKGNPWLEQLGRLAPGVPPGLRQLMPRRQPGTLYVCLHDQQTLILADKAPMDGYLEAQLKKDSKAANDQPANAMFTTINEDLKTVLEHLQPAEDDANERLLFVTASLMQPAEVRGKSADGFVRYRPRQVWDITALLEERQPRLKIMGTCLVQGSKRTGVYKYRTELTCGSETEALEAAKSLEDGVVPKLVLMLNSFLDAKVAGADDNEANSSDRTRIVLPPPSGPVVKLAVELNLDAKAQAKALDWLSLLMIGSRAELAFFEETDWRRTDPPGKAQLLSKAVKSLPRGMSNPKVAEGWYPPGAFPRSGGGDRFIDPGSRISWMAGLLPYLEGYDEKKGLYSRISFHADWRDPLNWPAGRTLVPQFIDPSYPDHLRYFEHPELPTTYGATHFVGIAGVGLESGDYGPIARRGILGYDHSVSKKDVENGRGLANTILMIQVPPDGPAGITPWIAGGGYTLRGVPEKNSIQPFIATKDAKGRPGTYALMADGSVRFIAADIGDEAFQAMCTYAKE